MPLETKLARVRTSTCSRALPRGRRSPGDQRRGL